MVSRVIGENSQISRQQISSSSYLNQVQWWVKHLNLPLSMNIFSGVYFVMSPLSTLMSSLLTLFAPHASHPLESSRVQRLDAKNAKSPRHLTSFTAEAASFFCWKSPCCKNCNIIISIFPETIKLWDNQNRVYAAPAEMLWHSRHSQILWFWWVLWCKFYQFSNDLIDPKAWVVIELQISTGNFRFTDPLLLYESS